MDKKEQLFLRVVEAGSLKAAAEQMNTDPSSVSRKIAALEAHLGVKLLQRSTRRSEPTEAGSLYYEGMSKLLSEQTALEARVSGEIDTPTGLLRVTAPVDFGANFVTPVLKEMQEVFPELAVELLLGSGFLDLASQNIDVAVRIGKLPDSSLIGRNLGTVPRVMVASQSYISAHETPRTVADLQNHKFILYSPTVRPIHLTAPDGRKILLEQNGRFTVNSVTSVVGLVQAGHGIHVGPKWAFRGGLENGSLIALLPDYGIDAFPIHALYRSTAYVPAKIRHFIDRMTTHKGWE